MKYEAKISSKLFPLIRILASKTQLENAYRVALHVIRMLLHGFHTRKFNSLSKEDKGLVLFASDLVCMLTKRDESHSKSKLVPFLQELYPSSMRIFCFRSVNE
eukprot:TRINITY_DN16182_c0_g1_i1.p1 TRINITY_DN16182_c0_g1~~TRINITY_DN16182_c0_g1_i1.p1  ORF type:complete len:118 (+),score=12.68 TRINITY_DN16182_c0_g1_i1:46-354(+)